MDENAPPSEDQSSLFHNANVSPTRDSNGSSRRGSPTKLSTETITVKDFFDFMKTAYQVYENLDSEEDDMKIDWEELTKLTVLNHVIDQSEKNLLIESANAEPKVVTSASATELGGVKEKRRIESSSSCSELEVKSRLRKRSLPPEGQVEMLGVWTEASLNCKLNDVLNEGILDSILPYLVGYKKPTKTTSVYTPDVKTMSCASSETDLKKPSSFGGLFTEKESRDRLGRRKSSVAAAQEISNAKHQGDVEIHVCDEVKGMKKDFRCPQKLLITKMGYFADVTVGQRLEDMDISVHCDIQIFDWLMRWVKKDTILVADWPIFEPVNVVPILVSASFLQMEPLLHDCLSYCHAHLSEIVKTSTNLACLSDTLLTRLSAMYTNVELESVKDKKDKILSRLYCKMIVSLAEPVPETLRGHYSSLANLFKCSNCNKLLGQHIAEKVPCQPASMVIDRHGNVLSMHIRDAAWDLNEYIVWLHGELRSWRRVYWRLWAECHFLKCLLCDNFFPAYQMEWCSYHESGPQMFCIEGRSLPAGRFPCCGERAYRFDTISRSTGCKFREHAPNDSCDADAAVVEIYSKFREIITMRPPELVYPERLTRLVAREPGEQISGRLQCKETFWWEGIQLIPKRPVLGLLGKLFTSDTKFNPLCQPGTPGVGPIRPFVHTTASNDVQINVDKIAQQAPSVATSGSVRDSSGEQNSESDSSESETSECSEEDVAPKKSSKVVKKNTGFNKKRRAGGREWLLAASARSNQDGQRRFEERLTKNMRVALSKKAPINTVPNGGVYVKLETEWRERHDKDKRPSRTVAPKSRTQIKYK